MRPLPRGTRGIGRNHNDMMRYLYLGIFVAIVTIGGVWGGRVYADVPEVSPAGADDAALRGVLASATEALQHDRLTVAEELFVRALRMHPQSREARFGMGALLIKQGRYTEAIEMLEQLRAEYPDEYSIINNLAWLYATATDYSMRNGPRAVALAQEALLLQPHDYHVWNTLSEAYYVSGNYERAFRAARETLRVGREAGVGRDVITQYERQVDKCRRAVEVMSIVE